MGQRASLSFHLQSTLPRPLRVQPAKGTAVRSVPANRRVFEDERAALREPAAQEELQAISSKQGKTTSTLEASGRSHLRPAGAVRTGAFIHVKPQRHGGVGVKGVQGLLSLQSALRQRDCTESRCTQYPEGCRQGQGVTLECCCCVPFFLLCAQKGDEDDLAEQQHFLNFNQKASSNHLYWAPSYSPSVFLFSGSHPLAPPWRSLEGSRAQETSSSSCF